MRSAVRALALLAAALPQAAAAVRPGAILVADWRGPDPPGGGVGPGAIVEVDPVTGAQVVLVQGSHGPGGFSLFDSMVRDSDGTLVLVAWDEDRVRGGAVRIDPDAGTITRISTGGLLHFARGLALEAGGTILVGDDDAGIVRIAADGTQSVLSAGGLVRDPQDVAVEPDGAVLVVDSLTDAVVRIDPVSGAQSIVSQGGMFYNPSGLALDRDGSILVADENCCAEAGGDPFPGGVIRVDPATGAQSLVSGAGLFSRGVRDLVVDARGDILVTDRIAGVIRVHPATGAQQLVSSGGGLQEPWGIVVEPSAPALLRVLRWPARPIPPAAEAFATVPCSTPSADLVLCDEAAGVHEEVPDPAFPARLAGDGALVLVEYDSDTVTAGTADLVHVSKDASGDIVVTTR